MPEDPHHSKYRSVPVGDLTKMPEAPHRQQTNFNFPSKGDSLDRFVYSRQRRMEGLERFKKKRRLRAIPESSLEEISTEEDTPPPSESDAAGSSSVTAPRKDRLIVDEMDVYEEDDDDEITYPCPYCFAEFEFLHLCHHLEDEHYDDDATETSCSICSNSIRGDMLRHLTTEHEPLFKMALQQDRFQQIPDSRSQELSLLARDLRDTHLSTHLSGKGQSQSSSGMMDPLLSSLVINYPAPGAEEISKLVTSCAEGSSSKSEPAQPIWQSSLDPSLSSEEREKKRRQAAGRAAFVQDLVWSTMFSD